MGFPSVCITLDIIFKAIVNYLESCFVWTRVNVTINLETNENLQNIEQKLSELVVAALVEVTV